MNVDLLLTALVATGVAGWVYFQISYALMRRTIGDQLQEVRDRNYFASAALAWVETHSTHEVVPVEAGGEIVEHLCVTCDKQLSEGWAL